MRQVSGHVDQEQGVGKMTQLDIGYMIQNAQNLPPLTPGGTARLLGAIDELREVLLMVALRGGAHADQAQQVLQRFGLYEQ